MPEAEDGDALRRLEERLLRASAAAERLVSEAAEAASRAAKPPPQGYQAPEGAAQASAHGAADRESRNRQDLALLLDLAGRVRDLVPPDLQRRLAEALRDLLLAVRAVIDWYLERLERRRREPPEVTDIPID